jgi:hypothetical protein
MSAQTNEFQRLIALLTRALGPGAEVTESWMTPDPVTGVPREVDVVAIQEVAGHRAIVGIECRDRKDIPDVRWVEEAHTRFQRLGINVGVLVSAHGFTAPAEQVAASYGIKTITPGEVTPEFVGKVVNSADRAEYRHWVTLVQKANVVITRDGVTQQQELPGNVPVFFADGTEVSMFEDLVNHVMRSHTRTHEGEWEEAFRRGEETYGKGKWRCVATGDGPEPRSSGQKVYMKGKSNATGEEELFEIANVIVTFQAERTVADVPLTHGEYDGTYYSTGSAALGETSTVQLVYTETPEGKFEVVGRIDGPIDILGLQNPIRTDEADASSPADRAPSTSPPPGTASG